MRRSGRKRKTRPAAECAFISALFYSAFGESLPGNWSDVEGRRHRYLTVISAAAKKLTRSELRILACIADGIDIDGSSLRNREDSEGE